MYSPNPTAHTTPRPTPSPASSPEAAEELFEVLAEELDPQTVFESERLDTVLRLLDLPRWLIAAQSLPKDVPSGPRRTELSAWAPVCTERADGSSVP